MHSDPHRFDADGILGEAFRVRLESTIQNFPFIPMIYFSNTITTLQFRETYGEEGMGLFEKGYNLSITG